jgi:polar amino acid transport system substrate-binding protein
VEGRVPEVKLGHVDIAVANLAYTLGRADQIQFSDPYYIAKEMLAVKARDPGKTKEDFKGKRLASTKGSTSELSIKLNGSEPLTFQDTGSAFMAVQQNKALGMVANTMTITKLVNESKKSGVELKMIEDPMILQPIGVGMKKDEPALLAKINETLASLDKAGEINRIWDKWLGPGTEYKMVRTDKVTPLGELKFTPIP